MSTISFENLNAYQVSILAHIGEIIKSEGLEIAAPDSICALLYYISAGLSKNTDAGKYTRTAITGVLRPDVTNDWLLVAGACEIVTKRIRSLIKDA